MQARHDRLFSPIYPFSKHHVFSHVFCLSKMPYEVASPSQSVSSKLDMSLNHQTYISRNFHFKSVYEIHGDETRISVSSCHMCCHMMVSNCRQVSHSVNFSKGNTSVLEMVLTMRYCYSSAITSPFWTSVFSLNYLIITHLPSIALRSMIQYILKMQPTLTLTRSTWDIQLHSTNVEIH